MIAKRMTVIGKVQGVYFRASTKQQAYLKDLRGWVRNHPDGSVEIHVEGKTDNVYQLVDWAQTGPRLAEVIQVKVSSSTLEGYQDFEIRK